MGGEMTTTATDSAVLQASPDRPDTFRQSLLAKHDKCPASAALYLQYDGGTDSHAKTRGSIFHLFMQRATETMLDEAEPTMPGEMGRELADAIMAEDLSAVLSAQEQDVIRQCAWNWCEATVLDLEALIGVEVPLHMELGGVTVTCRLDRLEVFGTTLYIRDAKTSLAIRTKEDVEHGFQGMTYALAALDGFNPDTGLTYGAGITDVWFYEEYPRYRTDEGPLITREAGWTRSELAEFKVSLERNIAAFEQSFETGEWPARDGSWCSICPAQKACPIPTSLRAVDEITTDQEAQYAFSRAMALDREKRSLQDGLRGWVKQTERPIFRGDLAFAASPSTSRSVDWDAVHADAARGKPFNETEHVTVRTSTKFSKRRQTEEELHVNQG